MKLRVHTFFRLLLGCLLSSIVSCAPLTCLFSGKPCKKIRLQDESGNPVKRASAGGDPLSPAIMNASNDQGYLVLSKHWANPNTGMVTIGANGFVDYTRKFEDVPKIVVLKKNK